MANLATAMQTNVNLAKGVQPFRSAPKPTARRSRMVVTQASKEPSDFVKKAAATFAAAALTLSAPAFATESGIMPSRNRDEDNAARAFLDSKEKKGPQVQSRSTDPNSGKFQGKTNPDPRDTRNAQLGGNAGANGRSVSFYNTADLQVNVDAVQQAKNKISDALGDAKQAGNKASNLADDAAGNAKSAAKNVKQQRNVAYGFSGLQTDVVFGIGETGTTSEQAGKAAEKAKEAIGNPGQSAKNAASRTGQEAERVLSNPTGGPEQSRNAADQLADANAEVPRALQGGAQKVKDAVTPSSFSGFDTAALQRNAGLEGGFDRAALQQNVRVGDLQSISGGQAKKAGPDSTVNPSDSGKGDAQLTTDRSTSGVKARPGPGEPDSKGAAERAESRPGKLESGKIKGV